MDDDGNLIIARPKISGKIKLTYDEDKETERAMEVDADAYMAELRGQVGRAIPVRHRLLVLGPCSTLFLAFYLRAARHDVRHGHESGSCNHLVSVRPGRLFASSDRSVPPPYDVATCLPNHTTTYLPEILIAPFSYRLFLPALKAGQEEARGSVGFWVYRSRCCY